MSDPLEEQQATITVTCPLHRLEQVRDSSDPVQVQAKENSDGTWTLRFLTNPQGAWVEWGRRMIAYMDELGEREPMDGYRKAELAYEFKELTADEQAPSTRAN